MLATAKCAEIKGLQLDRPMRGSINRAIEQDRAGVPDYPLGPARDHAGTNNPGDCVHPEPAERAGQ